MMASNVDCPPSAATATGSQVWDRLWRSPPSVAKDTAMLERERQSLRWARAAQVIRDTFGSFKGLRTIELGSGRGDFSVLLAAQGASVTLFDYSKMALDQARHRFDRLGLAADYVQGDMLGDLDGLRRRFDFSVSLGVIEHFQGRERTRVIGAHHNVLRKGGLTLISVPNALCPPYRLWKMLLEIPQWWPYGLEIPYSRGELTRRAKQAGFARIEMDGTGFWRSVGDLWGRSLLGRECKWADRPSWMDRSMGLSLQLFGRRTS